MEFTDTTKVIHLTGRIDSNNATDLETSVLNNKYLAGGADIIFDAQELDYISSAGLRVLLKVKKHFKRNVTIRNVSDDVYDIFEVTGFDDMFEIERQMRTISIRDCARISSALNGEIFQLPGDEMIKVYDPSIPLSDVKKERAYTQTAMICGVPTLIPYDVVSCEQGYGIIFEKAEMNSLAYLISRNADNCDFYAMMLGKLMRELHSTEIPEGKLPDIKERYKKWIAETKEPESGDVALFSNLISSIPDKPTYVHGDINLNSVMVMDGELLLLDMSGSARGNPLFDISSLYASLVAIEERDEGYCKRTYGIYSGRCRDFWDRFFSTYMEGKQDEIYTMNKLLSKYCVLKENVLNKVEYKHRVFR